MMKTWIMLSVVIVLLTGCATYPVPVKEPIAGIKVKDTFIRTEPDYKRGGLNPPTNLKEAIKNLKIYGDTYQDNGIALLGKDYRSDDVGLAGAGIAAIGGLTKSVTTAVVGTILGTGGPLYSSRYSLRIQSKNYISASDSMYCMYNKLIPVENEFKSAINTDSSIFNLYELNDLIDQVRRKLRTDQIAVELTKVSFDDLKKSVQDTIAAIEAQKNAEKDLADTKQNDKTNTLLIKKHKTEVDKVKLAALKVKVTACVVSLGESSS